MAPEDFFSNAKTPEVPGEAPADSPSPEELLAFWQAQHGTAAGAQAPDEAPETDTTPAPLSLDDDAYTLKVGQIAETTDGHFVVVLKREPIAGADGSAVPGYRMASLTANDTALPLEAFGIQED